MPPFGTCFQSKVGPGYALQAATHGLSGALFAGPGSVWSGPHRARSRRCAPPVVVISFGLRVHGRNGGNNDMEGAAGRTLSVGPWTRTSSREADVFRLLSKRPGNLTPGVAGLLEVRMRRIVHHELGQPSELLRLEESPSEPLGANQVRVRVSYAPIHPGDLLGVMGSPAFGTPPTIGPGGRVPGFEGAGVVSEVGARVDTSLGLRQGLRVAFFPAPGSWRDEVVVPVGSVTPLPDTIPDEIGAQLLINSATALTAIRTAHESVPPDSRSRAGVVVLLTAAGSAVGRLLGKLLTDRGVKVIRLVRSEVGAEKLAELLPGSPTFATDAAGWKERARAAAEGAKIHVAIDSVGGALLGDVAELLADGTGTVVNLGSLGGEASDIRLFAPRALTLKGVFLGQWMQQPADVRQADIALAQRLALESHPPFEVAASYPPLRIGDAVAHVGRPGRNGVVLFDFSGAQGDAL